mgnify:FL=1
MPLTSRSGFTTRVVAALLLLSVAGAAGAQPGNNSPNQFGDRQSGQWGDPGQGYFGNPSVGEFDRSQLKEPPPGTRPLGRVSNGKAPISPYISLPPPADAAPEVPAADKTPKTKQPAKKKRAAKTQ